MGFNFFLEYDRHNFPCGGERFLGRTEDVLHDPEDILDSGENVLLEREDNLERGNRFPGRSEDNLKACEHLLHLSEKDLRRKENGRSDSEMFHKDSSHPGEGETFRLAESLRQAKTRGVQVEVYLDQNSSDPADPSETSPFILEQVLHTSKKPLRRHP
jgi:hypothetical protein